MQRLFSIFPNGWPGGGLLVLRIVSSGFLLTHGIAGVVPGAHWEMLAPGAIETAAGILILIGLWTPVGCALAMATEAWLLLDGESLREPAILLLSISAALAMLGPGFCSIDALVFGRRRMKVDDL